MRHMSIVTTAASIIPQPLLLSPVPSVSTSLHHLLQTENLYGKMQFSIQREMSVGR